MNSKEPFIEYRDIKDDLEKLIEIYMKNKGIDKSIPGYIEIYWGVKKELLKEIYNIDWKSPRDIDLDTIFN